MSTKNEGENGEAADLYRGITDTRVLCNANRKGMNRSYSLVNNAYEDRPILVMVKRFRLILLPMTEVIKPKPGLVLEIGSGSLPGRYSLQL
jgi:hypothetical protein